MTILSPSAKQMLVAKVLNRKDTTIIEIAKQNNVGLSTLNRWVQEYRTSNGAESAASTPAFTPTSSSPTTNSLGPISRSAQFTHLLATHNLDEVSCGAYCRANGIYAHQLNVWKNNFISENEMKTGVKSGKDSELSKLKQEVKKLQQELNRKDKALSEASALLILKKKANLIWGEEKDA